jgi:HAL2 family 3'(2'),5'-bisphosphate nucleotidase
MERDVRQPLSAMVAAVRAAARVCRDVQARLATSDAVVKADASPVTVADLASQALIVHALATSVPGVPVAGEEDAALVTGAGSDALRATVLGHVRSVWADATEQALVDVLGAAGDAGGASGRFFTVDPIDGTKGFLRGEQYAVALALIDEGRVVAGVLGCPNLVVDGVRGVIVHAAQGQGTSVSPLDGDETAARPVRVSEVADPRRLRLCESVETGHSDHGASARLRQALGVATEPVRLDSQAKYAVIACGGAELYLRTPTDPARREWIWDHAAGQLVVAEAGGRVTDLDGAPLDFSCGRRLARNRGIVATNGRLHEAVLATLA